MDVWGEHHSRYYIKRVIILRTDEGPGDPPDLLLGLLSENRAPGRDYSRSVTVEDDPTTTTINWAEGERRTRHKKWNNLRMSLGYFTRKKNECKRRTPGPPGLELILRCRKVSVSTLCLVSDDSALRDDLGSHMERLYNCRGGCRDLWKPRIVHELV